MADIPSDFVARDYVFIGKHWQTQTSKMMVLIRLINEDGTLNPRESMYAYSKKMDKTIGGIYRGALFTDKQSRGMDGAKYTGRWSNTEDIALWESQAEDAETAQANVRLEKDDARVTEIAKIMKPLRKQYETMRGRYDHGGMEALERAVVRALRTQLKVVEK
jgi:hypothetical protein